VTPATRLDHDDGAHDGRAARLGTFTSLRYRDYRLLWLGQASHAAALWMEQIARPWLVLEITGDNAAHVGGVVAMRTLPQLLFGVWAGVIADWFDRKSILLGTKAGVLVLNVVFAALLVSGNLELWHVYAASLIRGTFMSFDQPARQSLIGQIVPARLVTNAVALMSATQNTMRIAGAAGSGFFIGWFGLEATFVAIAAIYLGAVVATAMLRVPAHEGVRQKRRLGAMGASLLEGARYAAGQPAIRGVLLLSFVYFAFGMSWGQVFAALFARTVLDIGSGGFGLLLSTTGIGAPFGTLVIAARQPTRVGILLPLLVTGMGAMLVLFSAATYLPGSTAIVLAFAVALLLGALRTAYMSLSNATLITAAPEAMRGRVMSLISLDRAMVTAGASIGGLLAAAQGVQAAQIVYGVVVLVFGLATLFLARGLRSYEIPEEEAELEAAAGAGPRAADEVETAHGARHERPAGHRSA
jgi:MFS family permease